MRTFKEKYNAVEAPWRKLFANPYKHWLSYNWFGKLTTGILAAVAVALYRLVGAVSFTVLTVFSFVCAHVLWVCFGFILLLIMTRASREEARGYVEEYILLYKQIDSPAIVMYTVDQMD